MKTTPMLSLHNGDRMSQPEFHERYEAYPKDVKFELVGGTVFVTHRVSWIHGSYVLSLCPILGEYCNQTPGIECASKATAILGEESEPQPDLALRLLPEYGGQSHLNEDKYLVGAPELVAEIAFSSRSIDMNLKRADYQQAGVAEYIVLCVEDQELHWFNFRKGDKILANREGVWRSRIYPGLWIDGAALLACDSNKLNITLQQGLATPAHAAFVRKLERVRRKNTDK